MEPALKRLATIEKLGQRMLRLMAGNADAIILQRAAMALGMGVGGKIGKRLHEAAEVVGAAMGKSRNKKAG
jgi:hypothetical protein